MTLSGTNFTDFDIYIDAQVLSTLHPSDRADILALIGHGVFIDLWNNNPQLIQESVDLNGMGVFLQVQDFDILALLYQGDQAQLLSASSYKSFFPSIGSPAYDPAQAAIGQLTGPADPQYLSIEDTKFLQGESLALVRVPIKYTVNGLNPDFENGSYLKIGPHIYGGEVQSVRILEDKAIEVFKGARSNSDFLVDSGSGDADIEIVLMFRDSEAIANSFRPLVALFRMSPITSVRNKIINGALQNDFISDNADGVQTISKKAFKKAIQKDFDDIKHATFAAAYKARWPDSPFVGAFISPVAFAFFQKHDPGNAIFNTWPTYEDFLSTKSELFDLDVHERRSDLGKAEAEGDVERIRELPRKDTTGHVPVAFIAMEAQTHPELPEALVVKLLLKRIEISNYVRDGLTYRTINNTPTGDPRRAYWLRRALDIYIDSHLDIEWIFRNGLNESRGDVILRFGGDNIVIKLFKEEYDLHGATLNHADNRVANYPVGTVISQMSFSIANKFSFIRLQGKSYPTVQFMGSESGRIMLTIRTNDEAKFKAIHGYKSAADFFVRTADRIDRFNGWYIDSWLTRLFNTIDLPEIQLTYGDAIDDLNDESRNPTINQDRFPRSAWYPTKVVTATNDESPGLRDISMVFAETNPDFFSDFGFTVQRRGYSLESFTEFFSILYDRAMKFREVLATNGYLQAVNNPSNELNLDLYAFNLFWGDGTDENQFSVINPDTIVACFLELGRFDPAKGNSEQIADVEAVQLTTRIINELSNDRIFSGEIDGPKSLLDLLAQDTVDLAKFVASFLPFVDDDVTLTAALAKDISAFYFGQTPGAEDGQLVKHLRDIPEHQDELYQYIWERPEIILGDNFKQALLAALISRRDPILGDRIYSLQGVINAYNAITLAVDAKGTQLFDEDLVDSMIKSNRDEKKIFIAGDGYQSRNSVATSYPDYPFITYEQLFGLPGTTDNWHRYLPTFQDVGIINPDPKYHIARGGFTAHSVTTAQTRPKVGDGDSPIPPSVFFYSEPEYEQLRDNLDQEVGEWFDHLSELRLDLPFDIERMITDEHGRATGARINIPRTSGATLPTRIEKMIESTRFKIGLERFSNATADLLFQQAKSYVAATAGVDIDDLSSKSQERRDFVQEVQAIIRGDGPPNTKFSAGNVSVPILMGSHIKSDVVTWVPLTGLFGDKVTRTVLREADRIGLDIDQLLSAGITRDASGSSGGAVITAGDNMDEARVSMLKITQAVADNANNMIRAFPAMRVYLLDFVGPRVIAQDNFYGYHAVHTIDITLDKNDADLCVIRLADPFHVLQGRAFNNEFKKSKNRIGDIILPATLEDIKARDTIARIALKQGRPIQIRGGYASEPDNLDILFTGRISEIQFGDVVTIVAQSWKAELISRSVEMELKGQDNSSVKDLVVSTIRKANPAGIGDQYSQREAQQLFELAGSFATGAAIFNAFASGNNTPSGPTSSFSRGTHGLNPFGFGIFRQFGQGLDMRLKNVWVPDTERSRWSFFADMSETGWQSSGWTVPMTSAWEVLQNATNYIWGYIAQVVPYDGEATLFFGKPEQMYYYTDGDRLTNQRTAETRAKAIDEIKQSFDQVIDGFTRSIWYSHPINILLRGSIQKISTPTGNVNYLGGVIDYFVNARGGVNVFDSSNTSFITHRYIHNYWKNLPTITFDGLAGASKQNLADNHVLAFNKFMLGRSFVDQFQSLVEILGDPKKTAVLLLGKFYGLNYEAITGKIVSSTIMGEMLKKDPRTRDLKRALGDMFGTDPDLKAKVEKFLPSPNITKEQAQAAIGVLGNIGKVRDILRTHGVTGTYKRGYPLTGRVSSGKQEVNVQINSSTTSPELEEILSAIKLFLDILPDNDTWASKPSTSGGSLKFRIFEVDSLNFELKAFTRALAGLSADSFSTITITEDTLVSAITLVNSSLLNKIEILNQLDRTGLRNRLAFESDEESILEQVGVDLSEFEGIEDYVIEYLPLFRSFVYFLSEYMVSVQSPEGAGEVAIRDSIEILKDTSSFDYLSTMNMKVFRDYHYIRNGVDIVENNIAASTREMYNTVIVRYPKENETTNNSWTDYIPGFGQGDFDTVAVSPETEWTTWPSPDQEGHIGLQFDPSVVLRDKKVYVYTDLNAHSREQAARLATNVLTKNMRPMYRNNILILGRAIKPWDHIYLDDKFVDMFGPLDVERVVHHYGAEKGWVTNIVPHAMCEASPGNRHVQAAIFNSKVDKIFNIVDYSLWALTIATLGSGGVAALGAKAGASTLRHAIAVALRSPNSALRLFGKGLKAPLAKGLVGPDSPLGKGALGGTLALSKKLAGDITLNSISKQYKVLASALAKNGPNTLKSLFFNRTGSVAAGQISRYLIINHGAGKEQLPVTFSPLIFKGSVLQAGIEGEDLQYWSMASKAHWGWRDFQDGIGAFYSTITHGFTPHSSYLENTMKLLQDGDISND